MSKLLRHILTDNTGCYSAAEAIERMTPTQTKHIGRVRIKLAAMLREQGYDIQPEGFFIPEGWYRTNVQADVIRWDVWFTDENDCSHQLGSWDTMTDCVRYGFDVEKVRGDICEYMATSRRP